MEIANHTSSTTVIIIITTTTTLLLPYFTAVSMFSKECGLTSSSLTFQKLSDSTACLCVLLLSALEYTEQGED
jgi:hypothetical protein